MRNSLKLWSQKTLFLMFALILGTAFSVSSASAWNGYGPYAYYGNYGGGGWIDEWGRECRYTDGGTNVACHEAHFYHHGCHHGHWGHHGHHGWHHHHH